MDLSKLLPSSPWPCPSFAMVRWVCSLVYPIDASGKVSHACVFFRVAVVAEMPENEKTDYLTAALVAPVRQRGHRQRTLPLGITHPTPLHNTM